MPAKDVYHNVVRTALEKDGWVITDAQRKHHFLIGFCPLFPLQCANNNNKHHLIKQQPPFIN